MAQIEAHSFLHNRVRITVGTLKQVGEGKWSADDVAEPLEAKERAAAGPTAPPDGLYLWRSNMADMPSWRRVRCQGGKA